MNTQRLSLLVSALLFLLVAPTAQAFGITCYWFGGAGNWSNANNWSCPGAPGATPGYGDTAIINGGTVAVNVFDLNLDRLTVVNATLSKHPDHGAFGIAAPGGLTLSNATFVGGGVTTNNSGGVGGPTSIGNVYLQNAGTDALAHLYLYPMSGGGTISITGAITGDGLLVLNGGDVAVEPGATIASHLWLAYGSLRLDADMTPRSMSVWNSSLVHGTGALHVGSESFQGGPSFATQYGRFEGSGPVTVGGVAEINGYATLIGRTLTLNGGGVLNGYLDGLRLGDGAVVIVPEGQTLSGGGVVGWDTSVPVLTEPRLEVRGTLRGHFDVGVPLLNEGVVASPPGGTLTLSWSGTYDGAFIAEASGNISSTGFRSVWDGATVSGEGFFFVSNATIEPTTTVSARLSVGSGTVLNAPLAPASFSGYSGWSTRIGGTNPTPIHAAGDGDIGGFVDLRFGAAAVPAVGDTFTLVTCGGTCSASFPSFSGPEGYAFAPVVTSTSVGVTVTAAPTVAVIMEPEGIEPLVVGPGGGSVFYTVRLLNPTSQTRTFDVWTEAYLPNGGFYGPIERQRVRLPARSGVGPVRLRLNVPASAPAGAYTYFVRTGTYPSPLITSDYFAFVKGTTGASVLAAGPSEWSVTEASEAVTWVVEGAQASSTLPATAGLDRAYPNPFLGTTRLAFAVPELGHVRMAVYDLLGREIAVLLDEAVEAGRHAVRWDATGLAAGVYLVRFAAGDVIATQRITLVR